MNYFIVISLSAFAALSLVSLPGNGFAQQADVEGVKATSNAFYSAIAALDNGVSMEKIWAQTVTLRWQDPAASHSQSAVCSKNIGIMPTSCSWRRKASLSELDIHVNGNLAWEVGQEIGQSENEGCSDLSRSISL